MSRPNSRTGFATALRDPAGNLGKSGSHSFARRVRSYPPGNLAVCFCYRQAKSLKQDIWGYFGIVRTQRLNYRSARHFASGVTTQPISNREQPTA
jgi:hypothetical protein